MVKFKISYIFPNLITAFSIFTAVLSIIYSVNSSFENAVYMILISGLLDVLDGKVARMTNSQSKFGLEFDSLADIVSFGVAPAMLLYFSVAQYYGKAGILITAGFIILGAIRLARFNSVTHKSSVFLGLPIPAGAIFVATGAFLLLGFRDGEYSYLLLYIAPIISILMVSNIRYPSFKKDLFSQQHIFRILIIALMLFSLTYIYPIETVFAVVSFYLLWGIMKLMYNIIVRKMLRKK